ncbi:MAG: pilin [Patescibacteria group bacterium]
MKKISKILPVFLIFCFLALPLIVSAQWEQTTVGIFVCGLLRLIRNIVGAIGFAIAVIMLIWGAIKYMTAGGDPEKAKAGRQLMLNAVIGIVILLAVMFIITLVAGIISGTGITWNPFIDPCREIIYTP